MAKWTKKYIKILKYYKKKKEREIYLKSFSKKDKYNCLLNYINIPIKIKQTKQNELCIWKSSCIITEILLYIVTEKYKYVHCTHK